jgi:LGFP repeat
MPTNIGAFTIFGAIEQKWIERGGVAGLLGAPLSNESPTFDGLGRAQTFKGGVVSWHPTIGAHEVHGAILARWLELGRERFGRPITDESPCPDNVGRFNHFRALEFPGNPVSSIYWSPATGAHDVFGAIREKWASIGFERSVLGFPVLSPQDHPGGAIQHFQGGVITWTPEGGPVEQAPGDTIRFDSGQVNVPGSLPLNGNVGVVVQRNGAFTFDTHVHNSEKLPGSIDYAMVVILVTSAGNVFEFVHKGTVDGLFSDRQDDQSTSDQNPALAAAFDDILTTGRLQPTLTGKDNLVGAITDLIGEAVKELAAAGIKALVTVIVG